MIKALLSASNLMILYISVIRLKPPVINIWTNYTEFPPYLRAAVSGHFIQYGSHHCELDLDSYLTPILYLKTESVSQGRIRQHFI